MSKNKVIKKRKDPIADPSGGSWVSGPIDWPDVAVIQRALETWSKGAKLDFEGLSKILCNRVPGRRLSIYPETP